MDIIVLGRARLIVPAGETWDSWFEGKCVSSDFMESMDQPKDLEREAF